MWGEIGVVGTLECIVGSGKFFAKTIEFCFYILVFGVKQPVSFMYVQLWIVVAVFIIAIICCCFFED